MGCDINLFLEYKSPITRDWQPFGYGYYISRVYSMFAKMAAVRSDGYKAIFQPRGLPKDLSDYVREEHEKVKTYEACCHTPSWLSKSDFCVCIEAHDAEAQMDIFEYKAILAVMTVFEEYGCDSRIVFWFCL